MDKTVKNIMIIFLLVLILYLMNILSSLLIPLVLALLFAAMFQPLVSKLQSSKIPNWFILPIIMIITLGLFILILDLIVNTVSQIANQQEYLSARLDEKFNSIIVWFSSISGLKINSTILLNEITKIFDFKTISTALTGVASGIGSFGGSFLMFSIYYVIFLVGLPNLKRFIAHLSNGKDDKLSAYGEKIQNAVVKYMVIKTSISVITGLLVYIVCLIFGIKFAILWGLITFILNFIPSIGSIIATFPPLIMAVIQFDGFEISIFLFSILATIQFVMGNIIEPKIMGKGLKLNTITIIFGLVFWGYIWGITGMLLAVPLLVIIRLIFEHIPSLNLLGRLMGIPEK